jgi:predicted nuclease with TOPRIM domain
MAQKKITIETLAAMINEGFKTTATKEDFKEVKEDVAALRTEMQAGFDRIEHLLLEEQRRKIENLETRMKRLEDALAV